MAFQAADQSIEWQARWEHHLYNLSVRRLTVALCPPVGAGTKLATHTDTDGTANAFVAPGSFVTIIGPSLGVQREAGGGTYAAERFIGYKALRKAGLTKDQAKAAIAIADAYFESIGVVKSTVMRIPGNRR